MNANTTPTWAAALLLGVATPAVAQEIRLGIFAAREGYDQADFGAQRLTIKTRDGEKTLRVSISKLSLSEAGKMTPVRLPKSGLALIQHSAGAVKVATDREKFEPLEGEWLRLPLPAELRIGTDGDSILMDLIVIEEDATAAGQN